MSSRWKIVFLATTLLGLSIGVAAAATASVGSDASMRSGPGTNYPVEAVIPAGSIIEVKGCSGSWCQVEWAGNEGFVARSLIATAGGGAYAVAPGYEYEYQYGPEYYTYGPDYYYSPGVGFGFYYDRGHHRWVRRDHRDRNHNWSWSERYRDRIDRRQTVIYGNRYVGNPPVQDRNFRGSQNFQHSQLHVQQNFQHIAPRSFQVRSGTTSRGGPSHGQSKVGHHDRRSAR
jgi:uncharacterized protein YraI